MRACTGPNVAKPSVASRSAASPRVALVVTVAVCTTVVLEMSVPGLPLMAQSVQYTPPGAFRESRESTQKILERNMTEARWKAGLVLLDPWFDVRDTS